MTEKYTHFAFNWGYAESSYMTLLLMKHSEGFRKPLNGIIDLDRLLSRELIQKYGYTKSGRKPERDLLKECCKSNIRNEDFDFCPKCGASFKGWELDEIDTSYQWERLFSDLNDLGSLWEFIEESGWSFCMPESADWVTIHNARNISEQGCFFINHKFYKDEEWDYE